MPSTPNGKGTPTIKTALKQKHKWQAKGTALFQQMAKRLSKINWTVSQRQTESKETLTIIINHKISIALELWVINYWVLKPVLRCNNSTLGSAAVHIHIQVRSTGRTSTYQWIKNQNSEHINEDSSLRWNKTSTQQQTNSETLFQQKSNSWKPVGPIKDRW